MNWAKLSLRKVKPEPIVRSTHEGRLPGWVSQEIETIEKLGLVDSSAAEPNSRNGRIVMIF